MEKTKKIKLVILVGSDGTGKTTIKKALEKASKYRYFVVDRLTDSIVFNKIFHRNIPSESDILNFECNLKDIAEVSLIYLTADTKILVKRLQDRGENIDKKYINFINKTKQLFEEDYLDKTYFDYTVIDTGKNSINKCVELIIKFMEKKYDF